MWVTAILKLCSYIKIQTNHKIVKCATPVVYILQDVYLPTNYR